MKKLLILALAAALPAAAQPAGPLLWMPDSPTALTSACDDAIAKARATVAEMEAKAGGAGFLVEWNQLQVANEGVIYSISNLGSLHPDKAMRDAAEPCLQKASAFNTDLFQSEKLYARVQAIQPADPREAKLKKNLVEGFEDSGVVLPPDKRARQGDLAASGADPAVVRARDA